MLTKIAEQIREEGKAEGGHEAKHEYSRRMLEKGYPIEDICDITGLSREEVEKLKGSKT